MKGRADADRKAARTVRRVGCTMLFLLQRAPSNSAHQATSEDGQAEPDVETRLDTETTAADRLCRSLGLYVDDPDAHDTG